MIEVKILHLDLKSHNASWWWNQVGEMVVMVREFGSSDLDMRAIPGNTTHMCRYMVVQVYMVLPKGYSHFPFELHTKTLIVIGHSASLWRDRRANTEDKLVRCLPILMLTPRAKPVFVNAGDKLATSISNSSTELEWRGKNIKTYCWWKKSCATWDV